jgi:hypothetical protein
MTDFSRAKTPEPLVNTFEPTDSPSQIPDSQPLLVGRSAPDAIAKDGDVDVILSTPAVLDYVLPAFTNIVSPQWSPRPPPSSYHPSHPSPRAVHLVPLNLAPKNTKPQTQHAISPDRTSQIPIFSSTPKSRPLKDLLPESVNLISS